MLPSLDCFYLMLTSSAIPLVFFCCARLIPIRKALDNTAGGRLVDELIIRLADELIELANDLSTYTHKNYTIINIIN